MSSPIPSTSPAGNIFVRSMLAPHSDMYSVVVEAPWRTEVGRLELSVGGWFTEAGDFDSARFGKSVEAGVLPLVEAAASRKGGAVKRRKAD